MRHAIANADPSFEAQSVVHSPDIEEQDCPKETGQESNVIGRP